VQRSNIEILNLVIDTAISKINTLLPCKITKYDFKTQKCSVQPLVNHVTPEGDALPLPIINNIPLIFPASGGASMTMPVNVGDFVEVRFCQRSLESWLSNGLIGTPDDPRSYDLTDGIATPGLNPFSKTSPASNNEDFEIKYSGSTIAIKKSGDIIVNGSNINVNGENVNIEAVKAIIKSDDISLGENAAQGIARLGDSVVVAGVTGTITTASTNNKSL